MLPTPHPLHDTVLTFLREHKKMVLAVTHPDGHPNLSIMHYAIGDTASTICFGTRKAFKKFALLEHNPDVSCMVLDGGDNPLRGVSIRGIARELTGAELQLAHALFKMNNTTTWYIEGHDDIVMFGIHVSSVHWLDGSTGTLHEDIVPLQ